MSSLSSEMDSLVDEYFNEIIVSNDKDSLSYQLAGSVLKVTSQLYSEAKDSNISDDEIKAGLIYGVKSYSQPFNLNDEYLNSPEKREVDSFVEHFTNNVDEYIRQLENEHGKEDNKFISLGNKLINSNQAGTDWQDLAKSCKECAVFDEDAIRSIEQKSQSKSSGDRMSVDDISYDYEDLFLEFENKIKSVEEKNFEQVVEGEMLNFSAELYTRMKEDNFPLDKIKNAIKVAVVNTGELALGEIRDRSVSEEQKNAAYKSCANLKYGADFYVEKLEDEYKKSGNVDRFTDVAQIISGEKDPKDIEWSGIVEFSKNNTPIRSDTIEMLSEQIVEEPVVEKIVDTPIKENDENKITPEEKIEQEVAQEVSAPVQKQESKVEIDLDVLVDKRFKKIAGTIESTAGDKDFILKVSGSMLEQTAKLYLDLENDLDKNEIKAVFSEQLVSYAIEAEKALIEGGRIDIASQKKLNALITSARDNMGAHIDNLEKDLSKTAYMESLIRDGFSDIASSGAKGLSSDQQKSVDEFINKIKSDMNQSVNSVAKDKNQLKSKNQYVEAGRALQGDGAFAKPNWKKTAKFCHEKTFLDGDTINAIKRKDKSKRSVLSRAASDIVKKAGISSVSSSSRRALAAKPSRGQGYGLN